MAKVNIKRTIWWNQDVKEAIRAEEDAFKALLQSKLSSDLQSHTKSSGSKNVQRTLLGEI